MWAITAISTAHPGMYAVTHDGSFAYLVVSWATVEHKDGRTMVIPITVRDIMESNEADVIVKEYTESNIRVTSKLPHDCHVMR